jgi:putative membrane protein
MKTKQLIIKTSSALAICAVALLFTPNAKATEKDTLNATDTAFVKTAAASGLAEVKIAGLGAQKASRTDVKAFAEMLATEHTAVNSQLQQLATTKGIELSATIDPDHAKTFQRLEQFSGTDFDKEFLATMVSGHKKSISNYESAAERATDQEVKAWSAKTLPVLRVHLAKAQELSGATVDTTTAADNTARNDRDRSDKTLTAIDQGNSKEDIDMTAKIRQAVVGTEGLSTKARNVKIITKDGHVTLRGPVNNADEKRIISDIATRIATAEHVTNQLEVTTGN